MLGCCCLNLNLFTRLVAWLSILVWTFNTFGWFILGYHWAFIAVYMLMGPFFIVASIYLLRATYNKIPSYVIPWLVMTIVGIIVTIINQSIWLHHYQILLTVNDIDIHIVTLLAGFAVLMYFWLCVYGFYQDLCRGYVQK